MADAEDTRPAGLGLVSRSDETAGAEGDRRCDCRRSHRKVQTEWLKRMPLDRRTIVQTSKGSRKSRSRTGTTKSRPAMRTGSLQPASKQRHGRTENSSTDRRSHRAFGNKPRPKRSQIAKARNGPHRPCFQRKAHRPSDRPSDWTKDRSDQGRPRGRKAAAMATAHMGHAARRSCDCSPARRRKTVEIKVRRGTSLKIPPNAPNFAMTHARPGPRSG